MDSSMVTLAQIWLFAGNFAPRGTLFCSGQSLSIAEYTAVFSLLGTTFGGDGQVNFNLPDFRGRMAVGAGNGPGLPGVVLGEMSGKPSVTILPTQMPAHSHGVSIPVTSANGTSKTPSGTIVSGSASNAFAPTNTQDGNYGGVKVGPAGGGSPISTRMPYLGLNFLMIMEGVYPSRN